jgi:AraC family transcriptional regulator
MVDNQKNKNIKIISQVGQYIYDHSDQTISLKDLAQYTGFSKYHFNRIFFCGNGLPVRRVYSATQTGKSVAHNQTGKPQYY